MLIIDNTWPTPEMHVNDFGSQAVVMASLPRLSSRMALGGRKLFGTPGSVLPIDPDDIS